MNKKLEEVGKESLRLRIDTPAPQFNREDVFGRSIDLKDYQGKKVMIAFFRHAGCPFCNTRVHALLQKEAMLKSQNVHMIFFFESTAELLLSTDFHKSISPVPLISDPDKVIYHLYGVEESGAKSAKSHFTSFFKTVLEAKMKKLPVHLMKGKESIKTIPAEFLIDEKGFVRELYYANGLRDRMSIDTILEFAKR